jgi:hypothetical protein
VAIQRSFFLDGHGAPRLAKTEFLPEGWLSCEILPEWGACSTHSFWERAIFLILNNPFLTFPAAREGSIGSGVVPR